MTGNIVKDLPGYFGSYYRRINWRMYVLLGLVVFSALLELVSLVTFIPILTGGEMSELYGSFLRKFYSIALTETIPLSIILLNTAVVILIWRGVEFGKDVWRIRIMTHLAQSLRLNFLKRVAALDYRASLKERSGDLANIMGTQTLHVVTSLGPFFDLAKAGAIVLIFFASAVYVEWRVALGWIMIGIVAAPLANPTNRARQILSKRIASREGRIQDLFIQLFRNFKYLKVSKARQVIIQHVDEEIDLLRKDAFRNGLGVSGLRFSVYVGAALVVLVAMYVMRQFLGYGHEQALLLTGIIYRGSAGVAQMYEKWVQFCSVSGSLSVLGKVEDRLDANKEQLSKGVTPQFEDAICFEGVSFFYDERKVLSDINLRINPRETVGIAGPSGAGKSTLLNLLIGLLGPTEGSVKLGGKDYGHFDSVEMRNLFGYVTQEPMLFNDTIRNNISLWSDQVSEDQIQDAAEFTGVDAIAARSEHGLDSLIGEQGTQISGGERQKIALAREICRDRPILILDEATSSLDSRSEEEINKSIHELRGQRTIIMVAHRLSSLRECSRIFVLNEGKIVESGNWEELVGKKNGVFRQMCELQGLAA